MLDLFCVLFFIVLCIELTRTPSLEACAENSMCLSAKSDSLLFQVSSYYTIDSNKSLMSCGEFLGFCYGSLSTGHRDICRCWTQQLDSNLYHMITTT